MFKCFIFHHLVPPHPENNFWLQPWNGNTGHKAWIILMVTFLPKDAISKRHISIVYTSCKKLFHSVIYIKIYIMFVEADDNTKQVAHLSSKRLLCTIKKIYLEITLASLFSHVNKSIEI